MFKTVVARRGANTILLQRAAMLALQALY